jgi:hypothetical protein
VFTADAVAHESHLFMKPCLSVLVAVVGTFLTSHSPAAVFYVDVNSTNSVPPYADWSTAATNIQIGIDAGSDGDLVLVTNGVYASGGRTVNRYSLTNRVVIDKAITVQSVNGAGGTVIQSYQSPGTTNGATAVRCVYMTNNAVLVAFTLTNGATWSSWMRRRTPDRRR